MKPLKTRTWLLLFAGLAAALAALAAILLDSHTSGAVAVIARDGAVIREIDLSLVTEEYRFTVEAEDGGHNEILVRPGRICICEADCPDQICVKQGWLTDSAMPIVCAPHRLSITLRGEPAGVDAATR